MNKESVDFTIDQTFNKVFNLLDAQYANKGITFIKNIEVVKLNNYENELVQVLINLLNNARDELLKKEGLKLIVIDAIKVDNKLHIRIKDNAGGINNDVLPHVFEPYFTTKHQAQGTGIGLYMSEQIIHKSMQGEISISNVDFFYEEQEHHGAEVFIQLDIS